MESVAPERSMERLLDELYEKKRWLDMVIAGLEAAVNSPEHRLLRLAADALGERSPGGPRVDLGDEHRGALASLARSVGSPKRPAPRKMKARNRRAAAA